MRVAIIHDWLVVSGGAEKVLEQLIIQYPQSTIFTLVDFLPEGQRHFLGDCEVRTSFIQSLPLARTKYRNYLPLMPLAVEQFDLSSFDVVISSSYAVAKGVITGPDQTHISYCHSPIRYAWDLQFQYLKESNLDRGLKSWFARAILSYIRMWDVRTSHGVDQFIANSTFIAKRIKKVYGRESIVLCPPVSTQNRKPLAKREDFYVTASRLVPYKRMDLIVQAFNKMPTRRLIVIGDGPMLEKLRQIAAPNVEVTGYQPQDVLDWHLANARAFVFAAEEDFGIAPVEAQSYGTPVIAFGKGGILDSVIEGKTGLFFFEQTESSICSAVQEFEELEHTFDYAEICAHAKQFRPERFREGVSQVVDRARI